MKFNFSILRLGVSLPFENLHLPPPPDPGALSRIFLFTGGFSVFCCEEFFPHPFYPRSRDSFHIFDLFYNFPREPDFPMVTAKASQGVLNA